jgi:hypothetical protein
MQKLTIIIAVALALSGCVPIAAGVVGYEIAKDQRSCWQPSPSVVYPDGSRYEPPLVNVCRMPLGLD